jgi:hypothetical protein
VALSEDEKRRVLEEEKLKRDMQGKSVFVAVLLSVIIPGLGDLYCGSWIKALVFFALDILCFILMLFAGVGLFIFAIVWIFGLISAWLSAGKSAKRKINKVEKSLNK